MRLKRQTLGFSTVALLAMAILASTGHTDPKSPEDTIRATSARVVEVLGNDSMSFEQKRETLDGYLDTCCDFETISKLVMAKNWKSLKPTQQAEFMSLFRKYLVSTYGDNIRNYAGETVEVLSGRKEARDDYTVMTKILRGSSQADLLVDYRMRKAPDGEWKIIDVIAEGISMVSNLRSQFQEVVTQGGTELLLRKLREKTLDPVRPQSAAS